MSALSILCVTRGDEYARPFLQRMQALAGELDVPFVLCCDGVQAQQHANEWGLAEHAIPVYSDGYIESVLDEAIAFCGDSWILRLDDDEQPSPLLELWLRDGRYREADHWCFPRLHLWPNPGSCIVSPPLWPDLQTRCSIKAKAGGRPRIHQGSPYGAGVMAFAPIEHHKFLVRSYEQRSDVVARYEQVQPGAGSEFVVYSLPELHRELALAAYPAAA